jgi:predicted phage gp36 major capsid-like protein
MKVLKKGGKTKKKKGRSYKDLDAAEKEVYRRGLAAYMSSGNRPKVSQHAWAMARVKSAFGKREAAKIRAGKGKKKGKKK